MTEPIDELLEWLHTFDKLQFSCNHRNVIEKIYQIKNKQQLLIPRIIVPKGTVCECENPDICQDNTGIIYCFECKEPMTEQTAL